MNKNILLVSALFSTYFISARDIDEYNRFKSFEEKFNQCKEKKDIESCHEVKKHAIQYWKAVCGCSVSSLYRLKKDSQVCAILGDAIEFIVLNDQNLENKEQK